MIQKIAVAWSHQIDFKLISATQERVRVLPCRPAIGFHCSLSYIVIAFHALIHEAPGAAILEDTFTASLGNLTAGIWHQASTVTCSTVFQLIII